jgi:hypothetical protein
MIVLSEWTRMMRSMMSFARKSPAQARMIQKRMTKLDSMNES